MTARTCQTCKHYEPSAVWRRGWCRNPRLYSPQQSQLVDQDALDCSRGLGSAWEAADADASPPRGPGDRVNWQPLRLFRVQPQLAPAGIAMMSGSNLGESGTGGTGGSGGSISGSPRPDRPGLVAGQERTVSYQPEERYWTDYLRVALPVAGLLLLLGVTWYWAGQLIGGGDDEGPAATQPVAEVAVVGASPPAAEPTATAATMTAAAGPPPSPTAPPPTPAVPTATAQRSVAQAPPPGQADETAPAAADETTTPEYPTYEEGTSVETTEAVNLRQGPSRQTEAIGELPAGSALTIRGPFEEGGDLDWWPVTTASGTEGFVREDFLRAQE